MLFVCAVLTKHAQFHAYAFFLLTLFFFARICCVCDNRPGTHIVWEWADERSPSPPPLLLPWSYTGSSVWRTPGSCFGLIVCLWLASPATWRVCCRTPSSACFNAASWCHGELRLSHRFAPSLLFTPASMTKTDLQYQTKIILSTLHLSQCVYSVDC